MPGMAAFAATYRAARGRKLRLIGLIANSAIWTGQDHAAWQSSMLVKLVLGLFFQQDAATYLVKLGHELI